MEYVDIYVYTHQTVSGFHNPIQAIAMITYPRNDQLLSALESEIRPRQWIPLMYRWHGY